MTNKQEEEFFSKTKNYDKLEKTKKRRIRLKKFLRFKKINEI